MHFGAAPSQDFSTIGVGKQIAYNCLTIFSLLNGGDQRLFIDLHYWTN
jgi:hypothetical protein